MPGEGERVGVFRVAVLEPSTSFREVSGVLGFGMDDDRKQAPLELDHVFGEAVLAGQSRKVFLHLVRIEPAT